MIEKKRLKKLSLAALTISVLPLATFIPVLLNISLDGMAQTIWAGANMVFVLLGLIFSVACVKDRENRNAINIVSTIVSVSWLCLMGGIITMAVFINYIL